MSKTMKSLVKGLDFQTTQEYYDYIISSKINGNRDQCCRLFKQMPKENRKEFLSYLADEIRNSNGNTVYYEVQKLLLEEL